MKIEEVLKKFQQKNSFADFDADANVVVFTYLYGDIDDSERFISKAERVSEKYDFFTSFFSVEEEKGNSVIITIESAKKFDDVDDIIEFLNFVDSI